METDDAVKRNIRTRVGLLALVVGLIMLLWGAFAPGASAVFATNLVAEPGQNPMPSGVTYVPENCKGIAPTPGSQQDTTQKQLNEGQGLVKPGPNSFAPGGTVHWLVLYNPTAKSASFDIRDCVVVFNPGNPNITGVLALIDLAGHGQIIPTPGSEPLVKGFDAVVDQAEFDFPDDVALPGEFDLSWIVPNAAAGALICNYAKDTGGSHVGGKENRKAGGACFTVPQPPPTTTSTSTSTSTTSTSTTSSTSTSTSTSNSTSTSTSTAASTSTTTTEPPTTSSTAASTAVLGENVVATTTTIPTQVLGEQFNKVAFTGSDMQDMLLFAGALIAAGGVFLLAVGREGRRPHSQTGSIL